MTATSAHSANGTPSTANPSLRDLVASLRTVQLPGSPATYANRAYLRGLGLRWDPVGHRWHGTTTSERVKELRERFGLVVGVFGDLEAPPKGPDAPKPAPPRPAPFPTTIPSRLRDPSRRPHDGSRTRVEARVAFPESGEEPEEIATPTRVFSLREITSGLPDDSREEDEREAERRLADMRRRVKAARAAVANTSGLAETLACDSRRATLFYARYGVSEGMLRCGVPAVDSVGECSVDATPQPVNAHARGVIPSQDYVRTSRPQRPSREGWGWCGKGVRFPRRAASRVLARVPLAAVPLGRSRQPDEPT